MAGPAKRNLDELAHHPDYAVKVQLERRETEADAEHRRRKDLTRQSRNQKESPRAPQTLRDSQLLM
ncbi:MAG: hypothetical protein JO344_18405 [Planctomycetaceae bacterium]|nr:hypothetical protein [Planctomycetaceae bacterium]